MHHFDIGLQLYTVRKQLAADPVAALVDVAEAGYGAVEFAGFLGRSTGWWRSVLDDNGLRAIGSHIDISGFEDLPALIDAHLQLGCSSVVIQQADSADFADVDAVARLVDRCNAWAATLDDAGLRLGYHGYHDFQREFAVVDGMTLFDRLVAGTDPELFDIQLDTYWVHHVGDDPVAALARYRGRVKMLHCKEIAAATDTRADSSAGGDAPVGEGVTDWPAVLDAAAAAQVGWLIVEQEDRPDAAPQDIRTSLRNLTLMTADRG